MKSGRILKNIMYEQVARIGKAVASPKRLELIEILCQGAKGVEQLALEAGISIKLASAHLKELKSARLVEARREGRNIYYTLMDDQVADLWVMLRALSETRLLELQAAMKLLVERPEDLFPITGAALLAQAENGEVTVIDVRPESEFENAHFPHARSIPLSELKDRIKELPINRPIVAYCRGPFCLMAKEAVTLMREHGLQAARVEEGVAEWRAGGLSIVSGTAH